MLMIHTFFSFLTKGEARILSCSKINILIHKIRKIIEHGKRHWQEMKLSKEQLHPFRDESEVKEKRSGMEGDKGRAVGENGRERRKENGWDGGVR